MEITEIVNEGLKRELSILIPKNVLEEKRKEKLSDVAKNAKIKGFRPGKVPLSHVERLYGQQIMIEVIEEQLESGGKKALDERGLKPAYRPDVAFDKDPEKMKQVISGGDDLVFTLSFEVLPTIELLDLSDVSLSKYSVEIKPSFLEDMVKDVLSPHCLYHEISESAEDGDRLSVGFVGKINGTPFSGGTAENVTIVLGLKRFIAGFEEQLLGVQAGQSRTITVTFPEDYPEKTLKGREAVFEVQVSKVERADSLVIDDETAKRAGLDSLQALQDQLRNQTQKEMSQTSHMKLRKDLLDLLDQKYSFDLPVKLVEEEFSRIWNVLERELAKQGKTLSDQPVDSKDEYKKLARRRVRLGLVFQEIGSKQGIEVTTDDLEKAVLQEIRKFPGREYEVYQYYRKNPKALSTFYGPVFETKVVDHLLTQVKTSDVSISQDDFEAMIKREEEEEGRLFSVLDEAEAGHDHDHHDHDHDHDHDHNHDHHDHKHHHHG